MARPIVRAVNVVLAGLLTGNEFGSWVAVHPALDDLPLPAHVRAEQAVTRRYGRIMPLLMSATLASFLPVLLPTRDRRSPAFLPGAAAFLCYGAMLAITLTRNVPINTRLLQLSPDRPPDDEFHELRARWDRLHTARNLLNLTGFALAVVAALSPPREEP